MEIVKMPGMGKKEYDQLIHEQHIARVAFQGEKYRNKVKVFQYSMRSENN